MSATRALGSRLTIASLAPQQENALRLPNFGRRQKPLEFAGAVGVLQSYVQDRFERFQRSPYLAGRCNVCGRTTVFFCENRDLYRESLNCAECCTTSRYRSMARGLLLAVRELAGVEASSLVELPERRSQRKLRIYDTQLPFASATVAYPLPEILARCSWIELQTSSFQPTRPWGEELAPGVTNQNLECLTFPDASFDIVLTSDVMEHVRLEDRAHREIRRVLRPAGIYLFTVPYFRDRQQTLVRVKIVDPDDPSRDEFLMEPEYHGDANSSDGKALTYRSYGTELDSFIESLGFTVDYTKRDFPELGIMNTELFYCRLRDSVS